jgi:hypothetical protein
MNTVRAHCDLGDNGQQGNGHHTGFLAGMGWARTVERVARVKKRIWNCYLRNHKGKNVDLSLCSLKHRAMKPQNKPQSCEKEEKNIPLSGIEPRFLGHAARNLVAVSTNLSRLLMQK